MKDCSREAIIKESLEVIMRQIEHGSMCDCRSCELFDYRIDECSMGTQGFECPIRRAYNYISKEKSS